MVYISLVVSIIALGLAGLAYRRSSLVRKLAEELAEELADDVSDNEPTRY